MRELRERAEPALKILCLILAALVVYQLAGIVLRWNPFRGVTVPALPALAAGTNSPPAGHGTNLAASAALMGSNRVSSATGTNRTGAVTGTNTNSFAASTQALKGTNFVARTNLATTGSNSENHAVAQVETNLAGATNAASPGTNRLPSAADASDVLPAAASALTNSIASAGPESPRTNAPPNVVTPPDTKGNGTNPATATNGVDAGTNVSPATTATGTNSVAGARKQKQGGPGAPPPGMAGMNFNPFGPPGKSSVELPPVVKSRIAKITDSEILGPVIRPLPMALLGIAGDVAFLRSAKGQTGLVKIGDSLDDLKLLGIGMNRVLIERNGQQQELMIFEGYGGGSLLPNNSTNENKHL